MINNINKNISVWRGEKTPPTEYHVWIKSNGSVLINKDGTWFTQISESTNDSVNVCNLSNVGYQPILATAIQTVSAYLGTKVFHVGYKLRYNEAPVGYDPIWKEYILTGSNWYRSDNWKLVFTTDLMNNEEIIKSKHLPSYVDDVLEYSTIDEFPPKGESGKIYLDTSTNKSYRWSGTQYVLIALTDIVTSESDGLMSSEMYNKLEKTAINLDSHDKQNQADFTEIREQLGQKVGKIVDSQGNIISEDVSISTIPDGTSDTRGLLTPAIYKQVEDNKKMSEQLDDNKVEEIRNFYGTPLPKVGSIVTIPNATTQTVGLMIPDDKVKLDSIESEFVKDLGLVASTDEGDQIAAKSEIAGNVKISFIRYRTAGVRAEKVTTIFQWRNGINETAQLKFEDKAQWRRNVTGATGVAGAPTNAFKWERTGAHYLGYDAANRKIQLMDYNQTVFKTVQLPLAQEGGTDGLLSGKDKMVIGSIITEALFDQATGKATFRNDEKAVVASFTISTATDSRDGLMSKAHVVEIGVNGSHRNDDNNPHRVTKAQVGLGNVTNDAQVKRSEMGQPDGVALLNSDGKIPSSYLPSYVSDIITVDSYAKLPTTGEEDKIYVTKDTNLTYRWSGTSYVEISPSLALGETSTTAYAGDKGKALSNSVADLENRVGHGYVNTETDGFAYIGTGDTKVKIIHGAQILASVVGQGTSFTISSNTDTASIGYGASIGQNSVLGAGLSASINNVTGPNGSTRQGIVLKDVNDDNCVKILCRNNGELLMSTSVGYNDWIDLARLGKISTMIKVSESQGLCIDPSILTGNSSDSVISISTNTTIGSNVTISSYVEIGGNAALGTDAKVYPTVTIGTGTSIGTSVNIGQRVFVGENTNIGLGVNIPSYIRVGTSIDGGDLSDSVEIGNDIIISTGINITKDTKTITIQNNNESSKQGGKLQFGTGNLIWSGAEIGTGVHITEDLTSDSTSYKLGGTSQTTIGKNLNISGNVDRVDILLKPSEGEAGKIKIQDTIGNANWLTLENKNNILAGDFYGGSMSTIWSNAEIGTGVKITEDLTADSTSYKLGETNQVTISKGIDIYYSDTEHALKIITPTTDGGYLYSFGKVQLGTNFQVSPNVSLGISLGTGSIDAVSYYQLKDPKSQLLTSSIGAGVTIQSGIQIKESDSGGIQIYVPSQAKWITIN